MRLMVCRGGQGTRTARYATKGPSRKALDKRGIAGAGGAASPSLSLSVLESRRERRESSEVVCRRECRGESIGPSYRSCEL